MGAGLVCKLTNSWFASFSSSQTHCKGAITPLPAFTPFPLNPLRFLWQHSLDFKVIMLHYFLAITDNHRYPDQNKGTSIPTPLLIIKMKQNKNKNHTIHKSTNVTSAFFIRFPFWPVSAVSERRFSESWPFCDGCYKWLSTMLYLKDNTAGWRRLCYYATSKIYYSRLGDGSLTTLHLKHATAGWGWEVGLGG